MMAALVFIIIRTSKLSPVVREKWLPILLKAFRVLSCIYRMLSIYRLFSNENTPDIIEFLNIKIFLLNKKKDIDCDDFNLTSIDEFVSFLSGKGYFPLILKPTRLSPENQVTKYSLLDQMWCNYSGGYDCLSGVISYDLSEHIPIVIIYMKSPKNNQDPIR